MKMGFVWLILFIVVSFCLGQKIEKEELVDYDWKYGEKILLKDIKIPAEFKEETRNYREGIISYLNYQDDSLIIIHRGGMMNLPFFVERDGYKTETKEEFADRTFRCGRNKKLYWCEVNFKRTAETMKAGPFPSNFAFDKIKKKNLELFKESLNTLVLQEQKRVTEKNQRTTNN